jgi:RNA polymerase sigma-70 factor (ECF subfamily)
VERTVTDPLADPEPLIRRVYAFVAYRVGDGPDAEDVTSDVFERAVRYRDTYSRSKGEPVAWLIGIARTCIADLYAHGAHRPATEELDADLPEPAETSVEEDTAERLALRQALERLDERERELLALRYGADLSVRQIGRLFDMKPNAVDVALHRARARLHNLLEAADRPPVAREGRQVHPRWSAGRP